MGTKKSIHSTSDLKVLTLFRVADVDMGVINWVNADLVTHIVLRV